ncbi:MAG: AraC family transcriptional regulator [Trueperaceae bacterium]|nr:AraC family transcriptional regulator [Trueperaceae bacterium]
MPQAQIERYFNESCLYPALKAIGQSRQVVARTNLLPHHEDYFEIHLLMDGVLHWWVEDETYTLEPDTVYLTKPRELHGAIKNTVQPCTLTWLQVDARLLEDRALGLELGALRARCWSGAAELTPLMNAMLAEVRRPQTDSGRLIKAYLDLFLLKLVRQYGQRQQEPSYPETFKDLLLFIDEGLEQGAVPSIRQLSERAGLSRSRIFQLFNLYLKQSPNSYINRKRIERAKASLKQSNHAVTKLALDLGYGSSQHFATAFKRMTGMTPLEYRKLEHLKPLAEERERGKKNHLGHSSL